MLPVIGREYAPDFDGIQLQGVLRDSLGSLKGVGELQSGETRAVRASFERTRSTTNLYVSLIL
jgi:hypothetical protein